MQLRAFARIVIISKDIGNCFVLSVAVFEKLKIEKDCDLRDEVNCIIVVIS